MIDPIFTAPTSTNSNIIQINLTLFPELTNFQGYNLLEFLKNGIRPS